LKLNKLNDMEYTNFFKSRNLFLAMILKVILLSFWMVYTGNLCFAQNTNANPDCNKEIAKVAVHSLATGFAALLSKAESEEEINSIFQNFIDKTRFYSDSSGYFYVYTMNCVCVAHATQKDLINKNLYDFKDIKGNYVIRDLSAAAKKGGGFVEYYWVKPGTTEQIKKLGYVEPIPGTYYFIGTGVYIP
jgi:signal transduction histidine kinase